MSLWVYTKKNLWSYTKRILKDEKGFIGTALATIGSAAMKALPYVASALPALGGLFGGKKEQESPEFGYYQTPQYRQLYDLLYQGSQQGIPGLEGLGQQYFQSLVPGIQETYQAKRGLGAGSTPEVAALGRTAGDVATQMAQLQAQARQRYAGLLAGVAPQPVTTVTPPGGEGGLLENLFSIGGGLGQSYLKSQQLGGLLGNIFRPSPAKTLQAPIYGQSPLQAAGGALTYGG